MTFWNHHSRRQFSAHGCGRAGWTGSEQTGLGLHDDEAPRCQLLFRRSVPLVTLAKRRQSSGMKYPNFKKQKARQELPGAKPPRHDRGFYGGHESRFGARLSFLS